ncbi:MAG: DUF1861 family protein [Nanoarchaeota archaeon]|nr:DUF1861 family protein [Nanoarchaeota archaeon]
MTNENIGKIGKLLESYNPSRIISSEKLIFSGAMEQDVYNVTAPFLVNGEEYLLGRVETRGDERNTKIIFFRKKDNLWEADIRMPIFNLQDPFIFSFGDEIIVGGVEVVQKNWRKYLGYRNVFYMGKDVFYLSRITNGPWGMKGIRFKDLPNGKIGVFTRLQGDRGGRGKIGFTIINLLDELKPRLMSQTVVIQGIFAEGEWGGVNEIHKLKNGKWGVLAHVARYARGKIRHYYPISFLFNYEKREISKVKILARREDLPEDEAKRTDLYYVVYPGGIVRKDDGTAVLYVGVGDAKAYAVKIDDPFLEYED